MWLGAFALLGLYVIVKFHVHIGSGGQCVIGQNTHNALRLFNCFIDSSHRF